MYLNPTVYSAPHHTFAPYISPLHSTLVRPYHQPVVYTAKVEHPVKYEKDMKMEGEGKEVEPIVYSSHFGVPVVTKPVEYEVEVPARYHVKSGEVEHTVYKREAESEPLHHVATPFVYSSSHYLSNPFHYIANPYMVNPYMYSTPVVPKPVVQPVAVPKLTYTKPVVEEDAKTVANDAITPFGYAAKGQYMADSKGALHIAKREAEPTHHFGYVPYSSGVYSPYHLSTPYVSTPYVSTPYVSTPYISTPYHAYPSVYGLHHLKTYSNDAVKPEGYAAKGQYVAETAGSLHVAKREAEADPAVVYRSPSFYPYTTPYFRSVYSPSFASQYRFSPYSFYY